MRLGPEPEQQEREKDAAPRPALQISACQGPPLLEPSHDQMAREPQE